MKPTNKNRTLPIRAEWTPRRVAVYLAAAYAAIALIRYLLATLTSLYPIAVIDEFLYYSIARSIAEGEGLLFRGQSADYAFILYPLTLVPVYLIFDESVNLYRALQAWNICLISLSVFPLYALGKAIFSDRKKAFLMALFAMLLPDMLLGGNLIGECILYPLFYTLIYCAYRYYQRGKTRDILVVGVLGGLIYFIKPGQFVPAAVCLLMACISAIRGKNRRSLFSALAGLGCAAALICALYALVVYGFGYQTSVLSLYGEQLSDSAAVKPYVFLKSLLLYAYYFILALGAIGFLLPFSLYRFYDECGKKFFIFALSSLICLIAGTAYLINMAEFTRSTIHLRYIAMYIPVFAYLCAYPLRADAVASARLLRDGRANLRTIVTLSFLLLVTLIFGVNAGMYQESGTISYLAASVFSPIFMASGKTSITVLIVVLLPAAYFTLRKLRIQSLQKAALYAVAGLMLINNFTGYAVKYAAQTDAALPRGAKFVMENVDDREFLYVFRDAGIINYGCLDVRMDRSVSHAAYDDLLSNTYASKGVYTPFIPVSMRGTRPDRLTPDAQILVMDPECIKLIKLSSDTRHIEAEGGGYHIVYFEKGVRWADSMMTGMQNRVLPAGDMGILIALNPALLASPLTVRMEIESDTECELRFFSNRESVTMPIQPRRTFYEFTFKNPQDAYNFIATDTVRIYGYELINTGASR